jgi:hypothetical protein
MAVTQQVNFDVKVAWSRSDTKALGASASGRTVSESANSTYRKTLENGTAADQSDVLYAAQHTINAASNLDLDLNALADTVFGDAATRAMVEVTGIHVVNLNTASGDDISMGAGSNPFITPFGASGDIIKIPANGALCLTNPKAGWAVTAGTGDILRFANPGANAIVLDIVLGGRSA